MTDRYSPLLLSARPVSFATLRSYTTSRDTIETRVDRFLASSETAFAIPVYQRNYYWTRVQCQQLFSDILAVGTDESISGHFIGSIVYVHDDVYTVSGLRELTVIDGQQRLTTLTLILVALYRFAIATGRDQPAQRIYRLI
jgi:uncharacterized protein with ParB-like and HNH nuclease domain